MASLPNSLAARDVAHVLHAFTDLRAHQETGPLIFDRGEGVRVWDDAGKPYIEAVAGLWSAALGYSDESLILAAERQLRKLPFAHQFGGKSHEPMIELAERLIAAAPVPMSKVFFSNSGSEANDTAAKMVWYFNNALGRPGKKKLISREGAYHGITVAATSLSGIAGIHRSFDLPLPGFLHVSKPHHYRAAHPGESEEAFATRCAEELEALILAEGPDTVAAFWAEPIMGAGGVILPPATYFEKIQRVLRAYDVLLVADEVICGFWRTGSYWGSQTYGLRPDILCCGKALSASYAPISAVMVNERVFEVLADESHALGSFGQGYTHSGHPVPAAIAVAALARYDELDIGAHVADVGGFLQAELRRRVGDHELVGEVRGVGLVAALEMVKDKATKRSFDPALKAGVRLVKRLEAHGVIARALPGDGLALSPPLIITREELDEVIGAIAVSLDELAVELRA